MQKLRATKFMQTFGLNYMLFFTMLFIEQTVYAALARWACF